MDVPHEPRPEQRAHNQQNEIRPQQRVPVLKVVGVLRPGEAEDAGHAQTQGHPEAGGYEGLHQAAAGSSDEEGAHTSVAGRELLEPDPDPPADQGLEEDHEVVDPDGDPEPVPLTESRPTEQEDEHERQPEDGQGLEPRHGRREEQEADAEVSEGSYLGHGEEGVEGPASGRDAVTLSLQAVVDPSAQHLVVLVRVGRLHPQGLPVTASSC